MLRLFCGRAANVLIGAGVENVGVLYVGVLFGGALFAGVLYGGVLFDDVLFGGVLYGDVSFGGLLPDANVPLAANGFVGGRARGGGKKLFLNKIKPNR